MSILISSLSDMDTSKLHFVKVPENHIVIDFDIPDESGKKSGADIHLHYIYTGDPSRLSRVYDDHQVC